MTYFDKYKSRPENIAIGRQRVSGRSSCRIQYIAQVPRALAYNLMRLWCAKSVPTPGYKKLDIIVLVWFRNRWFAILGIR